MNFEANHEKTRPTDRVKIDPRVVIGSAPAGVPSLDGTISS